jgi:hypothetical protein
MNRLRVALLSLLVLALVAGALPVTDSLAKWSRRSAVSRHKRYKRHSRAWWRRHRALMRARRERAAQRRRDRETRLASSPFDSSAARRYANAPAASVNLSLLTFDAPPEMPAALAPASFARGGSPNAAANVSAANVPAAAAVVRRGQMPFDFHVPSNWSPAKRARQGEAVYNVLAPDGRAAGTAVLAPVSLSQTQVAAAPTTVKTKTVGGVPVTALRRTVIDRMVAEGGWVTNDIVQESHGRRVFVVLAQTGTPGMPARSWTFYFTEIDGRVYSLATTAPVEFAAPLAAGSEQLMATLKSAASKNVASER